MTCVSRVGNAVSARIRFLEIPRPSARALCGDLELERTSACRRVVTYARASDGHDTLFSYISQILLPIFKR